MLPNKSLLTDAINIITWLENDQNTAWQERLSRDQHIAKNLGDENIEPEARVFFWWKQLNTQKNKESRGEKVANLLILVSWIVSLTGILTGITLTITLLRYDGTDPINVLILLTWLIAIPLIFFFLTLLIPLFNSINPISVLNPGRWVISYLKSKHAYLNEFLSLANSDIATDRFIRWRLILHSQQFGIAFAMAALLTLLFRASVTDLAFGWSTTLAINPDNLSTLLHMVAAPWSFWFSEAVPSYSLIEQSQFYRLDNSETTMSPVILTEWWKFIAMCLLIYGVAFRAVTLFIANLNFRRTLRNMLLNHYEVTALLDRLDTAVEEIDEFKSSEQIEGNSEAQYLSNIDDYDLILKWNDAKCPSKQSITQQTESINSQTNLENLFQTVSLSTDGKILIIVKSWEPPLLEFHDTLKIIRSLTKKNITVAIWPISINNDDNDLSNKDIWRQSIRKIQDPGIYIL
ncbi:MAG: DUF2868 domain-containing protein [Pseudomonadota bacterium]